MRGSLSWTQHGELVLQRNAADLAALKAEIDEHRKGVDENEAWNKRTEELLAKLLREKNDAELNISLAGKQVAENKDWRARIVRDEERFSRQIGDHERLLAQAVNQKDAGWQSRERSYIKGYRRDLDNARRDDQRARGALRESEEWLANARRDIGRTTKEISDQRDNLTLAIERAKLHKSLLAWKTRRVKLVRDLYDEFWESELTRLKGKG